jgi:hypothetical protein
MNENNFFTLGRTIDKKYLTNQVIIAVTIFSFLYGSLIQFYIKNNLLESIFLGFIISIITFLSWALNRELYPQNDYAAIAGAILFIIILLWYEIIPSLILFLFWFIIILRLINQTTGLKPTFIDRAVILIITIIISYFSSWILLIFMSIIFLVNFRFTNEKNDIIYIFIGLILTPIFIFFQGIFYNQNTLNFQNFLIIFFLMILFLIFMSLNKDLIVIGDYSNKKVQFKRIFSAQFISVFLIFVYILWFGDESIILLLPIWCIYISSIIFSFHKQIKKKW